MRLTSVVSCVTAFAAVFGSSSAFAQDPGGPGTIPTGSGFTIRDVSASDALYSSRKTLMGTACVATGAMVVSPGTSWFGGPARCNGVDYYFYQVALQRTAAPAPVAAPPAPSAAGFGSAAASYVGAGQMFVIRDIAPDDAYYSSRSSLLGLQCVASDGMSRTDGGWWGGPAMCAGTSYYFYKMGFDFMVAAPPPVVYGSASAAYMSSGTGFVVRDIATDDAYYSTRGGIIGQSCVAGDGMSRTDGAYWSGPAMCAGTSYYFYKMAFDVSFAAAPAAVATNSGAISSPLGAGNVIIIRGIATDDAYYSNSANIIGLMCVVDGDMHRTDGMYWAGGAICSDGASYYFYKASFDVVAGR